MKYLLLALLTVGCSGSETIYVLPGHFSLEEEQLIQDGAELWNAHVPAHEALNLVFGDGPNHRVLYADTDIGSPGRTESARGVSIIDIKWMRERNALWLLPSVAAHELGHLVGLHHNGGETDLMYGVNSWKNMQITETDLQEWRKAH